MQVIRRYKKLLWFDFLEVMNQQLEEKPDKVIFFELLDELRMRLLESISEGANFKLKAPAIRLLQEFETRMKLEPSFANTSELEELKQLGEQFYSVK